MAVKAFHYQPLVGEVVDNEMPLSVILPQFARTLIQLFENEIKIKIKINEDLII